MTSESEYEKLARAVAFDGILETIRIDADSLVSIRGFPAYKPDSIVRVEVLSECAIDPRMPARTIVKQEDDYTKIIQLLQETMRFDPKASESLHWHQRVEWSEAVDFYDEGFGVTNNFDALKVIAMTILASRIKYYQQAYLYLLGDYVEVHLRMLRFHVSELVSRQDESGLTEELKATLLNEAKMAMNSWVKIYSRLTLSPDNQLIRRVQDGLECKDFRNY